MINAIGEATVQQSIRMGHDHVLNDKIVAEQKAEKVRDQRPVENSDDSAKTDMDMRHDNTTTRHEIIDGRVIFERYNSEGRLIQMVPPGYVPFGEMA
jgi:hypothetical protein